MATQNEWWSRDAAAANAITGGRESLEKRGKEANIGQSETSTAANAAKLPYIAPEAEASVANLLLRNEDLQRQLEKARKGAPLEGDDKTKFETDVDAFARLQRATTAFNPDFVGTIFDLPGQTENLLQRRVSGKIGTPGQAAFWQEMNLLDMLVRNKYFGASLTPAERNAYAETTITPGMTAEAAMANLKARRDLLQSTIQRRVNSLRAGGYNPAQINAALGEYVSVLNPRWMSPEQERVMGAYASDPNFDPQAYQKMMLEIGDANGVRLDPDMALSAAQEIAKQRAQGATKFGDTAAYMGLQAAQEQPTEEDDREAVGGTVPGDQGGDGGSDGLGWGETLGGAVVNFPGSVIDEVSGIVNTVAHPIDTATTVGELGGGLLSMAGIGDFDQSTAEALGDYYANKYGSLEGFKKELATNPASILSDVAVVFSGGGAAATKLGIPAKLTQQVARLGPRAVRAADMLSVAAKNVDPITALTNLTTKAVPAVVRATGRGTGRVATGMLGTSTGAGGEAVREAARVGFERGTTGAPTNPSDAFLDALRNPGASADDVVTLARDAIGNLRQQASQRYTDAMQRFGRNPVPLDIDVVRQRMTRIKPKNYDAMLNAPDRPSSHAAWDRMNATVEHYAAEAAKDPDLLLPLQMDQFKQDLYDIGSKVGGAYDRDAARIARTAYNGVKDELVRHDPLYANTMRDYERAAKEAQQLETSFGLAAARGKEPNIESAGRKLSSIFRNNVNTNYGTRAEQARRLSELDPSGRLMPSLAGQTLSAALPRGLGRFGAGAAATTGMTGMALDMLPMAMDVPGYLSGYNLATLPFSSPRAVGEAAYYGGRAAGELSRRAAPLTQRATSAVDWLARKQAEYRDPLIYGGSAALALEAAQEPDLEELQRRYASGDLNDITGAR